MLLPAVRPVGSVQGVVWRIVRLVEEVVLRLEESLLPSISDVAVLSVAVSDEAVRREPPWMPEGRGPDPAQPASKTAKFEDPSGSPWPRGHPHPRQPRDRPRPAGSRVQPEGNRPPASHALPHRQTPGRRGQPGEPLPRAVAGPAHTPRQMPLQPIPFAIREITPPTPTESIRHKASRTTCRTGPGARTALDSPQGIAGCGRLKEAGAGLPPGAAGPALPGSERSRS